MPGTIYQGTVSEAAMKGYMVPGQPDTWTCFVHPDRALLDQFGDSSEIKKGCAPGSASRLACLLSSNLCLP